MGWDQQLKLDPVARVSTFVPPPEGRVTLKGMKLRTLRYWKTVRLIYLAGYNVQWMIPGVSGSLSSSQAATSLDVRLRPVLELHPERTSVFDLEEFVIVKGRAHVAPTLGTLLRVDSRVNQPVRFVGSRRSAFTRGSGTPGELGEQARWLPDPAKYVSGVWTPSVAPAGLDSGIRWVAPTGQVPSITPEYSYQRLGEWATVPTLSVRRADHLRLENVPMSSGRITLFVTAIVDPPPVRWASLLVADEPTGAVNDATDDLDLRLFPDGNLHLYSRGWHGALPLVSSRHTPVVFGVSLDTSDQVLTFFTMDSEQRLRTSRLMLPHSTSAQLFLSRSGVATTSMDVLDIAYFRGAMDDERIAEVLNRLDSVYGITTPTGGQQ